MTKKELRWGSNLFQAAFKPFIMILFALMIGAVLIINAGENPFTAYGIMIQGAFGTLNGFLTTLAKATPLIFTGLAASIAAEVGVFNIGVEGQLYFGALAAGVVGSSCGTLPAVILIPLCLLSAMFVAAAWAFIPGILNSKLKINIFVMFFMSNNIAILLTEYLANGPFKGDISEAATNKVVSAARLFRFSNYSDFNVGFLIALAIVLLVWFVMKKTAFGYECSALGHNLNFGEYIGIHINQKRMIVLLVSAMIAGLAGAEQVLGSLGRFYGNFSDGLGFTGIAVGLLASNNPIGVVLFALFFGAMNNGGLQMAACTSVPGDLINVLQSLLIILISGDFVFLKMKRANNTRKQVELK